MLVNLQSLPSTRRFPELRSGDGPRVRTSTDLRVRDQTSRVRPKPAQAVLAEARAISQRLVRGIPAGGPEAAEKVDTGKLTLREGFDLVLDPKFGKSNVTEI